MSGFLVPTFGLGPLTRVLDLSGDQRIDRVIDPDNKGGQGPLRAQVTIDEDGNDQLVVTRHPVEQGAIISDHSYKMPAEVRLRLGWSNAFGGYSGYARDTYSRILQLQDSRVPFSIVTGKRSYDNMLVTDIRVHTNQRFEYTLMVDVVFSQILLVSVQPIAGGAVSSDPAAHTDPTKTTPTKNDGSVQTSPTGGFSLVRSGTGPTEIPLGVDGGFSLVRSGMGPTEIPSGG